MLKRRTFCSAAAATPFVTGLTMTEPADAAPTSNTVLMELKYGNVTIELRPDLAPLAAERIRVLTAQGFLMAASSSVSFPVSWPRPVTRPIPACMGPACPTCPLNSPTMPAS